MLRPRTRRRALIAATGLCALVCAAPAVAEDIRIGLVAPLSGRLAPVGLAMKQALDAAVAETNAAGGVLGRRLVLEAADDGCAAARAEGVAGAFIAQRAALVIGLPCSGAAVAAAKHYGEAGVLLIAVGARHPAVTDTRPGATVLRLAGRDDRQGEAAGRWLLARAPGRRVAIVHDRTAYARAISDQAVATLADEGVEPVAVLPITANRRGYDEAVAGLTSSGAEAVLFAGYPDEAAIVVAGMGRAGLVIPLLGSDALATPAFALVAGGARGPVQVLLPTEPRLVGISDGDSNTAGLRARGALEAWRAAAERIGSFDGALIAGALKGTGTETPSLGEIRFDGNGDLVDRSFEPASARGGRWVTED